MAEFALPNPDIKIEDLKIDNADDKSTPFVCMVGITNSSPYDTSDLPNNANTFYTNINYKQLEELFQIIKNNTPTTNIRNQAYKNIVNYMEYPNTQVFFDFKCSSDCHSGDRFVDDKTTLLVFKFINVLTRKKCNIVVGDHSMGALFKNWDNYKMDIKSPIIISSQTTSGPYKMTGKKEDFVNSIHPILKNLGDMSGESTIDIEFVNMGGTKIFSVKEDGDSTTVPVKIISKGKSLETIEDRRSVPTQPVHCEFKYRNGMIIVSATHWCNLTTVNSKVDINMLRQKYSQQYGEEGVQEFEKEYQTAMASGCTKTVNRVVSDSVKYVCSNIQTPKQQYSQNNTPYKNKTSEKNKIPMTPSYLQKYAFGIEEKEVDNKSENKVKDEIIVVKPVKNNEDNNIIDIPDIPDIPNTQDNVMEEVD